MGLQLMFHGPLSTVNPMAREVSSIKRESSKLALRTTKRESAETSAPDRHGTSYNQEARCGDCSLKPFPHRPQADLPSAQHARTAQRRCRRHRGRFLIIGVYSRLKLSLSRHALSDTCPRHFPASPVCSQAELRRGKDWSKDPRVVNGQMPAQWSWSCIWRCCLERLVFERLLTVASPFFMHRERASLNPTLATSETSTRNCEKPRFVTSNGSRELTARFTASGFLFLGL